MKHLALEIGVEEMPTAYLSQLVALLHQVAVPSFARYRLPVAKLTVDGTPRRLVLTAQVSERQQSETQVVRGPALAMGWDNQGKPTRAAEGFARRLSLDVSSLEPGSDQDAGYLVARVKSPEEPALAIVPKVLTEMVGQLNPPRAMRWTDRDVHFIRPVRWVLALLDHQVVPLTLFDVTADRITYGNRTDHPGPIAVDHARQYPEAVRSGCVELSSGERKRVIAQEGTRLSEEVGGHLSGSDALCDEVADLVEWPVPFRGQFDPKFLKVPESILITAMEKHQRYFPVLGENGLLPFFIGVRNGVGQDLSAVVAGNEKVLRARLSDAVFFYQEDLKIGLAQRVPGLEHMVYQAQLGTYGDKIRRMRDLATAISDMLGLTVDERRWLVRAIDLAKADLLTHVVGEFPELQGVMGGIYARLESEPDPVCLAIADQYHPGTAQDRLPSGRVGQALALIDRLDTLAGAQVAGLRPTGSEDPFALRRSALGVARILVAGDLEGLDLVPLATEALAIYSHATPDLVSVLVEFVTTRLRVWLSDTWRPDWVEAVIRGRAPWHTLMRRLETLSQWAGRPEFSDLMATFKRVANLAGGHEPCLQAHYPLPAEQRLADALEQAHQSAGDVTHHLEEYWSQAYRLRGPVDRFFDEVLVMDPDPAVRQRRLSLLAAVAEFLTQGADLTRLGGERRG